MSEKKKKQAPALAQNRKARRDYQVLETLEAGLALAGTEVKSIRLGRVSLDESFARIQGGELYIEQMHVQPYEFGNVHNHDPVRSRKALLHKAEIHKLAHRTAEKGLTLIPLRLYLKRGKVKLALGLCRGKQQQDKRETLKRRTADLEARREMARRGRR